MAFIPFPVALPQGVQGGLWKIEEDESFFRQALFLFPEEEAYLSQFRDAEKRKEWLASRLIIRIILKPDSPFYGTCRYSLKIIFPPPFNPENHYFL